MLFFFFFILSQIQSIYTRRQGVETTDFYVQCALHHDIITMSRFSRKGRYFTSQTLGMLFVKQANFELRMKIKEICVKEICSKTDNRMNSS